jgi:hypothetical protein
MMKKKIALLDCTLRDGAYVNEARFGTSAIRGIIKKLQEARVDIIEVGWLKDAAHEEGSTYYHLPQDAAPYMVDRQEGTEYVAMIDWDRYDVDKLPPCDGKSIDAVRVVFPHGKHREGIKVAERVREKGYRIFLQAANTLAYNEGDLKDLAECINDCGPVAVSVVDTFGAMFEEDLERIVRTLDAELAPGIALGFHSHNNQQLSFALTMHFVELLAKSERGAIVDASLCGMGRGAGNATTELVASYLDRKQDGNYDMDAILDAIDTYMEPIQETYTWGYSTPRFIAGMYQCHVNNIAYLQRNHRTNARDMRNIIASLSQAERRKYDYDLLERRYLENQSRLIDDEAAVRALRKEFADRTVLLVAPGRSSVDKAEIVQAFIAGENPVVIGVNAICGNYVYDYLFFVNSARYDYAQNAYEAVFAKSKRIVLSSIKTEGDKGELVVNFNRAIKRGWPHFDNAVISALRLLNSIGTKKVAIAGFDGFRHAYNESYADPSLPTLNPDNRWDELNIEIASMFEDVRSSTKGRMEITFVTESLFDAAGRRPM